MTDPLDTPGITAETTPGPGRVWWREAVRVTVGAAVVVAAGVLLREYFGDLQAWLEDLGPAAPLAFLAVYVFAVPLFFPVSVLGFLAGALFGVWKAIGLLMVGGLISASIMYVLSRGFLADRVRAYAGRRPKLARFLALADEDSMRLMILLRLSPLHFSLVSYLLGAGRVRYLPYTLATTFLLPSAALQAWVGHAAKELGRRSQAGESYTVWQWVIGGLGIAAAVLLITLLGRMARRALEESTPAAHDDGGES